MYFGAPLHLPQTKIWERSANQHWSYAIGPDVPEWPSLLRLHDRTYPNWRN